MTSAAPPAAPLLRKSRRFTTEAVAMMHLRLDGARTVGELGGGLGLPGVHGGSAVDGLANALIGAAAADVAAHGIVDVGIGRIGFLCKERDGGHDLSGLTIAALGDVFFDPGLL